MEVGGTGETVGLRVEATQPVRFGDTLEDIGQINGSVSQLDHMTQQNAALVEQSAAAAESLKDQTARLSQAVSVFRLHDGAHAH